MKCHYNNVLEYKIDLYFSKYTLENEVDECSIDRTGDNEREEKMKKKS